MRNGILIPPFINWQHPLTRDLETWYLAGPSSYGYGFRNIARRPRMDVPNTTSTHDAAAVSIAGLSGNGRPGALGPVAVLDGVADYLTISGTPLAAIRNAVQIPGFTVSLWLRKTEKPGSSDNDRLLSLVHDVSNYLQLVTDDATGDYGVSLVREGLTEVASLTYGTYDVDVWVHIGFTYDGSSAVFYRNGVAVTSDGSTAIGQGTADTYRIGVRGDGQSTTFLEGAIDDVGMWNRALSADEFTRLYRQSSQGYPDMLTWHRPSIGAVTAAPGGLSIPIAAYHHFHHNMTS